MGKTYTYVDNSNFYIEGQRISAVKLGLAKSIKDAMENGIVDHNWQAKYGSLYELICAGKEIGDAKLWGSIPPKDAFWEMVRSHGFKVTRFDKNLPTGKEKKVDTAITYHMGKDSHNFKLDDEVILVAGDKDFCPAVEDILEQGIKVTIACWRHSTAKELIELVDNNFVTLDDFHDQLGFSVPTAKIIHHP